MVEMIATSGSGQQMQAYSDDNIYMYDAYDSNYKYLFCR